MKHKEILTRAWKILWNYKVLWVFGIILALTTSSSPDFNFSGNNNNNNSDFGSDFSLEAGDDLQQEFSDFVEEMVESGEAFFAENIPTEWAQAALTIGIVVGCLILVMVIVGTIFRYVSETSLIKMVDENEDNGKKYGIRAGFRLGFSRPAWRLFLINLVIDIPTTIALLLLFAIAVSPFFLWMTDNTSLAIVGTVAGIGMFFLVVLLTIVVVAALSLLKRFFFRVCVLEGEGVIPAIKRGFQIVRENFKDVALMWLIMVGITLGFGLAMIPVGIVFFLISAFAGGLLGLSVGGVTSMFAGDMESIVAGVVAGAPIFLLLLIVPIAFLEGLKETYLSTAWTLSYREVLALEQLEPVVQADEALPELEDSSQA